MKFFLQSFFVLLTAPVTFAVDQPRSHLRREQQKSLDALARELQFDFGSFGGCAAQVDKCSGQKFPAGNWTAMLDDMDGGDEGAFSELSRMVKAVGDVNFDVPQATASQEALQDTVVALQQSNEELGDTTASQFDISSILTLIISLASTLGIDLSFLSIIGEVAEQVLAAAPGGTGAILAALTQAFAAYGVPLITALAGSAAGGEQCSEAAKCLFDDLMADVVPPMVGVAFEVEGGKKKEPEKMEKPEGGMKKEPEKMEKPVGGMKKEPEKMEKPEGGMKKETDKKKKPDGGMKMEPEKKEMPDGGAKVETETKETPVPPVTVAP